MYQGSSGVSQYIPNPAHVLEGSTTIANGGIGGSHPYLSGVTIPSYVGAVNPDDSNWVAGVLGLADTQVLRTSSGDPDWIEGAISQPCTDGQTRSCSTGQPGICSSGTETCSAGSWGSCVPDSSPATELCTNSLDDDCDSLTDCQDTADCSADPSCQTPTQTCSQLGGDICTTSETCSGSWLTASDTLRCCPSICQSGGGTVTEIWGDSQDSDYTGTIEDTFIDVGVPTQNYATIANLNTYTWPANTIANAIILKWDLSAIPTSSTITSAVLQLYMDSMLDGGGDALYDISAHRITSVNPVISTCTWNTPWTSPGAQNDIAFQEDTNSMDKTLGYKSWSVTTMVRDWVSNPQENRGMLLSSDPSAIIDSNRFFTSSDSTNQNQRPKLIITYSGSGTISTHRADTNPQDGCILENELVAFITLWKQDSTAYPMREMMEGIALWRAGTGCQN